MRPTPGIGGGWESIELLKVTEDIQKLIMEKKDANIIKEAARKDGMRTLREDGWMKVKEGITTVSEVIPGDPGRGRSCKGTTDGSNISTKQQP